MSDIRLTGVPKELAARIQAAWDRSVESAKDPGRFWAERAEACEELAAAYKELLHLGTTGLLATLVVDAHHDACTEAREARRRAAEAVSR